MITIPEIRKTFDRLKSSTTDGIPGVIRIESGKPGPVLGITAGTHGNEPAGISVFHHLLNELDIEKTLIAGTLYLVVNNIRAAEAFFNAQTEEEFRKARYHDVNMNRLPKNVLDIKDDSRYEIQRAQEVYPVWQRFAGGAQS